MQRMEISLAMKKKTRTKSGENIIQFYKHTQFFFFTIRMDSWFFNSK